MAIAGSLTYDTKLDTKGFQSGLNKIGGIAKGVAVGVGASITAIGTGLSVLVKNAVDNYAEYEQLVGGVESIFGGIEKGAEQIKKVTETANEAWKNLTMSQNDYYKNFTSTYPLMKNDIEDQNEAIEQTNRLMTLESDLANTFGYSVEQASTAINWALKGSFNYIDNLNLGIKGTQEGFLEAARNAGYMVDDVKELSSSDILDILEKTADQFGVLGRTSDEASKTIQGSVKMMKASFNDLLTAIASGEGVDVAINNLLESISTVATNVMPVVMTILEQVPTFIEQLITTVVDQLPTIIERLIPNILNSAIKILDTLIQGIQNNLDKIVSSAISIISTLINGIITLLPDILKMGVDLLLELLKGLSQTIPKIIPVIIDVLLEMVNTIIDNIDLIVSSGVDLIFALIDGLLDALPDLIAVIPDLIVALVTKLLSPQMILKLQSVGPKLLLSLGEALIKNIPNLLLAVPKIILGLFNKFKSTITNTNWKDLGKNILNGILNGIKSMGNAIKNTATETGNKIKQKFKDFFKIKSPSKLMRNEIGKNLILGIGVAFDKDNDLIDKQINDFGDDIYKKMQGAVNMETGKMAFSGTAGSVSQILSSNATFDGNFVVKAEVEEGTLFEANQRITRQKKLQTGFGG